MNSVCSPCLGIRFLLFTFSVKPIYGLTVFLGNFWLIWRKMSLNYPKECWYGSFWIILTGSQKLYSSLKCNFLVMIYLGFFLFYFFYLPSSLPPRHQSFIHKEYRRKEGPHSFNYFRLRVGLILLRQASGMSPRWSKGI